MRLLLAVASLWAVAVFALRGDQTRVRYTEVDDRDVEVFRSGQTYKYRLDTQISSGMASISDQHAATRLRAEAQIHFQSDRLVSLKLKDIIVATTNQEIQEPEEVQPIQMFKDAEIKQEELRQLELPCEFDYVDGLVERVRFNPQDQPWSKNIKKSVLNMLQLNLKQRKGQEAHLEQPEKWQKEREQQDQLSGKDAQQQQKSRMFVMPETTLEGECQVAYTVNPVNARAKFNSYYDEQVSSSSVKLFNVTKTVDFHRCSKIADIRYGPKIEKPCANCTAQLEELEERKMDRTTIMRHVVVGSPDKYGIKRVETVSHYVFKTLNVEEETPMRTIVAARLSLVRADSGDREQIERELKRIETNGAKEESLLYSIEFDKKEKLFYMFGDDEFPQQTPFEKVQDKVGKIETALKKLAGMWSDKTKGIESEATLVFTRLVELLRMSSQEELKDAYSKAKNHARQSSETEVQVNTHDILVDALANAGTLNAIKLLADKIKRGDIEPTRATRAISLLYFPAPSEKQAKTLTELCEQGACKEHEPCRQVCWLTAGTLYGQLCDDALTVDDAIEQLKPQCHQQLKKDFVSKVMQLVDSYETRYKKIVLLKALGNAGLEPSVPELEKIIRNPREDPVVRMQAIDSLRRLRAVMPQKIQRVLLPVFQNVRERPEVRMMALSQVLATFPEGPIVDQIGYALLREPCRQVKSYVYKAMQQLSESPIEIEKELARHLKSVLKLAGITEEEEETLVRGSRYYRIPVYSQAKREGFLVDFESMFGQDNLLPKHLTVGLDTVFNGLFKKNALELSFTQEDIEQWFEKLMDVYMDFSYGMRKSESSLRGNRRSSDESSENDNNDFLKSIKSLGIKRRSFSSSERRVDSDSRSRNNAPYAMLNVRYGDVDYAVIPLEEEFLPRPLKEIVTRGRQPTIGDLKDLIESIKGRSFSAQGAMNLLENSVKIPTSAGFPLRMWHVIPVLASVEGRVQVELERDQLKAGIKIHPMVSATHLKRVEVWSPIVHTGVDTTRTVSVNLPVNTQLQVELRDKTFKWTVDVPTKEFRALNIHTLPLTYVTDAEWTQPRTPLVKRIENRELVHRAQHIDTVVGKKHFGTPLKINGEVHFPQQYTYPSIVRALLSTENHLHVEFQPQEDTPRKIVITGEGKLFEPTDAASAMHGQLKNFHSKSRFDREMDDHYSGSEDDERQFNRFIDDYQPKKLYKHQASFEIKTVGGSKDKQAQMEIEAVCDTQHRYVKAQLKAKRSPIQPYDESNSQWTMRAEAQAVLPDVHSSMQEYKRQNGEKQQRLVAKIESEWGQSERKQKISVNINGEQGRNPEWRQKIAELERRSESADSQKLRQQMIQKAAFINKYDISADYENLSPETKNTMSWLSTALKSWNFMNTNVESRKSASRSTDGQITAQVVIDPITHEHANVTLKTPSEIVRVDSMSLPIKIKPFTLVKPGQVQIAVESFSDIVRDYAAESGRECKVSSRKIRSFDDVLFKAPLTKCYSVLAKDCRSEQPRFAVLMKKIDSESKAIKMISKGKTIEVEPKEGKLVVKINGKKVTDEERLQDYGVDYNKNLVRIATRDVTVRFDGQDATVKIADSHKNTQCGLCGHYDDDSDDEFRMSNNELTSDLKSYQKSYSILDDECTPDFEETHRREEYKQLKKNNRKGGFWDSDEDNEEEYERKQQKQNRRKNNDNDEIEPIEKTETMEYNHKICFSVKPVKTCPEEAYPSGTKDMKVGFTCLDRSSSEARRLLREAQRSDAPISLPSTKPSFVETITVPSACVVY